jgi:endo-1,4-beta-D-glucanase Y
VCSPSCAGGGEPEPLLQELWSNYKTVYIQPPGYVLDRSRNDGEVTSEGQAYALLRAVWMGDKETFDRVLRWTDKELRRGDGLYSWRWSPLANGRVLDPNTATDADQLIAFALLLGAERFERPEHRERALEIVTAIRSREALTLDEGWFPAAGNWAVEERIVNLSYFLPFAYPYFARLDPRGDWMGVLERGYQILRRTLESSNVLLVPDFMVLEEDGSVAPLPDSSSLSQDFSFDAIRILWNVAFDCRLFHRPSACADRAQTRSLVELLGRDGTLASRYSTAGERLTDEECLCFYASALPAFEMQAPQVAESLRANQLSPQYLREVMKLRDRYYDLNWIWFGLALADGLILERTPPPEELVVVRPASPRQELTAGR